MLRGDLGVDLLLRGCPFQFDSRIADQVPADEIAVAAVDGIAKHALAGKLQE
jgi:hypothetical protein